MKNKKLHQEKNPWITLSKQEMYNNPWIEVQQHQVINPNGGKGIYGIVHFKNLAIGVLPIDEDAHTYLVGQYRYPLGEYSWEIPEGGCPANETPLTTAKRELLEETGLTAQRWIPLLETNLSNSVTDEVGFVFIARELEQGIAVPEETEELAVWRLPLTEAIEMAMMGEIKDSLSIMALLKVQLLIDRKELIL